MIVAQFLGSNYPVEISLHKLLYQINLLEVFEIGWPKNIKDRDYILMMKVTKELDFPKSSETKH
jgi:hypothetical protein